MNIVDTLRHRFKARFPVVWLESFDDPRVYQVLKDLCKEEEYNLYRWNVVDGLVELGLTLDTVLPVGDLKLDAVQVAAEILRRTDSYDKEIFVMEGVEDLLQDFHLRFMVKKLARELPDSRVPMHMVFISPKAEVPFYISRYVDVLPFPPCERQDYFSILKEVAGKHLYHMSEPLTMKLLDGVEGLTSLETRRIFTLAMVETEFNETSVEVIRREKALIEEKLDRLGGMGLI